MQARAWALNGVRCRLEEGESGAVLRPHRSVAQGEKGSMGCVCGWCCWAVLAQEPALAWPGVFGWAEGFRRARSGCGPGLISRLGLLGRLDLNLNSNGPFEFKFHTICNNQIEFK
jgi:hypothetical protein